MRRLKTLPGSRSNRGAALVEFALVAIALYLLMAAILGLGRWMFLVQAAQDAARFAAREMALYPLPADFTFGQALADPGFRQAVYSPDHLAVDLDVNEPGPALDARFAAMPVVNRALRPLMITSVVANGDSTRRILHMPGAVVASPSSQSGLTVVVPRVVSRDPDAPSETVDIVPVLEEVGGGSFSVTSPDRGVVALRLNVPYQSAVFSAYQVTVTDDGNGGEVTTNEPLKVGSVSGPALDSRTIVGPGPDGGPYSGEYGLGEHLALRERLRPFRRLITAQSLFRREVFLAPTTP